MLVFTVYLFSDSFISVSMEGILVYVNNFNAQSGDELSSVKLYLLNVISG